MRHLPMDNKMNRVIPIIIGVSIIHNRIRATTMIRWTAGIDNLTTIAMMIWVEIMAGTKMRTLTHTMIKLWVETNEEATTTSISKIIVTNRTTTVINSRNWTSSRVGKFKCIILRSTGMRTRMSVLTRPLKPLNRNFTSPIRMTISHRWLANRILKVTITTPRIITIIFSKITIFNNETGTIRLITRVLLNSSSMEDLIQSSTGINTSGHRMDNHLKTTFNRISSNINQITTTTTPIMSLTLRHPSLVRHSWTCLNRHLHQI